MKEKYYVRKYNNEFHVYKRLNPNVSDSGFNKIFICRFNTRNDAQEMAKRLNKLLKT